MGGRVGVAGVDPLLKPRVLGTERQRSHALKGGDTATYSTGAGRNRCVGAAEQLTKGELADCRRFDGDDTAGGVAVHRRGHRNCGSDISGCVRATGSAGELLVSAAEGRSLDGALQRQPFGKGAARIRKNGTEREQRNRAHHGQDRDRSVVESAVGEPTEKVTKDRHVKSRSGSGRSKKDPRCVHRGTEG